MTQELELTFHDKENPEEIHLEILEECRSIKTPKEVDDFVLPVGAERFYPRPETVFHDTVPVPEEELKALRERAKIQKDIVLVLFNQYPDRNFTPFEMFQMIKDAGGCAILTSIRRSITDLTKEGRLIKCDYSESRAGEYGTLNRVWKFNKEYTPPLNPK
jgi:hypothetical protein